MKKRAPGWHIQDFWGFFLFFVSLFFFSLSFVSSYSIQGSFRNYVTPAVVAHGGQFLSRAFSCFCFTPKLNKYAETGSRPRGHACFWVEVGGSLVLLTTRKTTTTAMIAVPLRQAALLHSAWPNKGAYQHRSCVLTLPSQILGVLIKFIFTCNPLLYHHSVEWGLPY